MSLNLHSRVPFSSGTSHIVSAGELDITKNEKDGGGWRLDCQSLSKWKSNGLSNTILSWESFRQRFPARSRLVRYDMTQTLTVIFLSQKIICKNTNPCLS